MAVSTRREARLKRLGEGGTGWVGVCGNLSRTIRLMPNAHYLLETEYTKGTMASPSMD